MDDILSKITKTLIVLSVLFIPSIGLSYKTLRFAVNYSISTLTIKNCVVRIKAVNEANVYFEFKIYADSLDYPIVKRSRSKAFKWKPQPKFDWCQYAGKQVEVYHYDQLKMATFYRNETDKENLFKLVQNVESGSAIVGFIILPFLLLIAAFMGGAFFLFQVYFLFQKINKDHTVERNTFNRMASSVNHYVFNFGTLALASYLVVMLGIVMIKELLYLEGGNNYFIGILLILGLNITVFGPGMLVLGVHKIRSSKSQMLILVRNVFFAGVLIKLATGITALLKCYEFKVHSNLDISSFLIEVLKTIILE